MSSMKRLLRQAPLLALLLIIAAFAWVDTAHAAAPLAKDQAPGFYRLMVGDVEVTALSDGTRPLPAGKVLTHVKAGEVEQGLKRAFLSDPVETSFNAFLINTGDKLVLIDTGAGALMGQPPGQVVQNLKAAGYQPDQVDEIYLTHMHLDHVGGLMAADQQRAFPNAIVRADRHEAEHWLSAAKLEAAAADAKAGFKDAMASVDPYVEAGRFKPFDGATELVAGIKSIPEPGHTPGHTGYMVESKGQRLLVWGDIIHVGAVQFGDPAVTISFDSDSAAAERSRKAALEQAAKQREWIAGAHLSFPGIGHVRAQGKGYVWVPANYVSHP